MNPEWWLAAIGSVGFPIVVALIVLLRLEPALKDLAACVKKAVVYLEIIAGKK